MSYDYMEGLPHDKFLRHSADIMNAFSYKNCHKLSKFVYECTGIQVNYRYFTPDYNGTEEMCKPDWKLDEKLMRNICKRIRGAVTSSINESLFDNKRRVLAAGYHVGDEIAIIHLQGEDSHYDGTTGIITGIDDIGQIHIDTCGLGINPFDDEGNEYDIIEKL